MKNPSQNSDKIGTFLTLDRGDPVRGIREITPYAFQVLDAWAGEDLINNSTLSFLEKERPVSTPLIKLFLMLRGENHLSTDQDSLGVQPGSMGVVLGGGNHRETWQPDEQGHFLQLFIGITPGRLSINLAGLGSPCGLPASPRIYAGASLPFAENRLAESFLGFLHRSDHPSEEFHRNTLSDILQRGVRLKGFRAQSSLVQTAIDYLLENPCHPDMSVQWLADRVPCHPDTLSRRFHLETGTPLSHTIRELRMDIASDLLSGGLIPVAEVAGLCGFRDHSYFSRIFRQTHGLSPSAFFQKSKKLRG